MIERLKESRGAAFGFKVVGRISGDEVAAFEPQIASCRAPWDSLG
jgi:hypothetical protein